MSMSQKKEIIKALVERKEIPERMGLSEDFWPETANTTWPQQRMPVAAEPSEVFNHDIVDVMEYWKPGRRMAPSAFLDKQVISENEETLVIRDGWGATMRRWKHKNGTPEHLAFDMTSREVWERKYREPLLYLDKRRFHDIEGLRERYKRYTEAGYYTMFNSTFVFEHMRYSMGDVTMLQAFVLDPHWVRDFCSVYTNFTLMHVEYLFREVGVPDSYTIYDDMAYNKGPFVSPAMYREFIVPYLQEFTRFLKSYGVAVFMHSCGRVDRQMANIIAAGIDCIQPMEAKTGMDLVALGRQYGDRIAFMGNIDIRALETNDRGSIEQEIVSKLNSVRENHIPFIFHSDHSISPLVSLDSYRYALQVFWENCRY